MRLYDWESIWDRIYNKIDVDALEKLLEKATSKTQIEEIIGDFLKDEARKDPTDKLKNITDDSTSLREVGLRAAAELAPEVLEKARPRLAPETKRKITKVTKDVEEFRLLDRAIDKIKAKGIKLEQVPEKVEGRGRIPIRARVIRTKTTFQDAKGNTFRLERFKNFKARPIRSLKTGRIVAWIKPFN